MIPPDELDRYEKVTDAATPGPWKSTAPDGGYSEVYDTPQTTIAQVWNHPAFDDAEFIAMARTAVPALLAEVREVQGENERLTDRVDELIRYADERATNNAYNEQLRQARSTFDGLAPKQPQWRPFDKDDKSTWPPVDPEAREVEFFFINRPEHRVVEIDPWDPTDPTWWGSLGVSAWMPIEVPEPPQ